MLQVDQTGGVKKIIGAELMLAGRFIVSLTPLTGVKGMLSNSE